MRRRGYLADVVERFIAGARVRRDLFGIIDVLGVWDGCPGHTYLSHVLGIQACVTGDVSKRVAKIVAAPATAVWLRNGLALEVWGWGKKGPRGKRKTWTLTTRAITVAELT